MTDNESPQKISRRQFLKRTGWVAAGLTAIGAVSLPMVRAATPALPSFGDSEAEDGLTWVQILPTGKIRFFCPRMEMGQGASLGLSQVVAEELNVDQTQVECVMPDTSQIAKFKMTVGSESIFAFFLPVAHGAASLREALRKRAADRVNLPLEKITDVRGGFSASSGTTMSYEELVPRDAKLQMSAEAPKRELYVLQQKRPFQSVGQSWKHQDLEAIVTGRQTYSRDMTVPGSLYGQVLRPPVPDATLVAANTDEAEAMTGVRAVVVEPDENFVGIVCDNQQLLQNAADAISLEWVLPRPASQVPPEQKHDLDERRAANDFPHTLIDDGELAEANSRARHRIAQRYDTSFLAHCPMEARASTVWVQKDRVDVWCGTQDPFFVQGRIAKITGNAVEDVIVHPLRMGGGFGGRLQCQASEEAARLSAAVEEPVHVAWDRETELTANYFQPAYSHFIEAGVTEAGALNHWQHDFVSSPILMGPMANLLGPSSLVDSVLSLLDRFVADSGTSRGAIASYHVPHRQIRFATVRTGVPTGAWRGLGAAPHAFAIESAMDELAMAASVDPLEFRLRNLLQESDRLANVLKQVARISGWGQPENSSRTRGIASAVYKGQTAVAVVAEVSIDHSQGKIRVTDIWCAHDCGLIVNPDQVRNLIEGNVIWGCSLALKEKITFEDGVAAQQNFDGYEVLRHDEAPTITISLVEPPDTEPVGVGESALPPVAPAIANAIFAATGRRLRSLPMTYEQLSKAAST